jgi:hypothetical protein
MTHPVIGMSAFVSRMYCFWSVDVVLDADTWGWANAPMNECFDSVFSCGSCYVRRMHIVYLCFALHTGPWCFYAGLC